jgi:YfiH family protein
VPHGFTTRGGGVSEGPYRSLNLSLSVGDLPERVAENVRALAQEAGIRSFQIQTAAQAHGARVLEDVVPNPDAELTSSCGEADALWTASAGSAVAVRVADCVPILIVDPGSRRVAAVHSGWRGTELKIVARTVEALVSRGGVASRLLVAIGPSIRSCCYAVSTELSDRFAQLFGRRVVRTSAGQHHLDLPRAVHDTLRGAGVRSEHIDLLAGCTSCAADDFFSHRRDKGTTGRQMGFVVCSF